jgi:hypothetical protein
MPALSTTFVTVLQAEMAKANKKIADAEVKTQRIASTAHRHEDRFREKHEVRCASL